MVTAAAMLIAFVYALYDVKVEAKWDWGWHGHFYHVAFRIPTKGEGAPQPFVFDCQDRFRIAVYATRGPGGVCLSLWVWRWMRGAQYNACLRYSDLEKLWITR